MAKKKTKKKAVKASKTPSLKDAMAAVQAKKKSGRLSDKEWKQLSTVEGILRKVGS